MRVKPTSNISAQKALAKAMVAKTEVEALFYYYQAVAFDSTLYDAVNGLSTLQMNIITGNIGTDLRNELSWARQWIQRLTELEEFVTNMNDSGATPFTLYYSKEIKKGKLDIQTGTAPLSIETTMVADLSGFSPISNVIKLIYDGLNATKKKDEWNLTNWPQTPVLKVNPFVRQNKTFKIDIELLNEKNKVLGKQTLTTDTFWEIETTGNFKVIYSPNWDKIIKFDNVNVDDITDSLSIRIAGVNDTNPEIIAKKDILHIFSHESIFSIGDKGPAEGTIFYDKGSFTDGWRYLEVAPVDTEINAEWGANGKFVEGLDVNIGTGKTNTQNIVKYLNIVREKERAAQKIISLYIKGYNDWFLPSKDELNLLYKNLHKRGLGDFGKGTNQEPWMNWCYWSSSQGSNTKAWYQSFNHGTQVETNKDIIARVRAIRAF